MKSNTSLKRLLWTTILKVVIISVIVTAGSAFVFYGLYPDQHDMISVFMVTLVSFLLGLSLAMFLSYRGVETITEQSLDPLAQIGEMIESISTGDDSTVIVNQNYAEISSLASQIQAMADDLKQREKLLKELSGGTFHQTSKGYLDTTVKAICDFFNVEIAMIGEFVGDYKVSALSMIVDGEYQKDYSYVLKRSDYNNLIERGVFRIFKGASEQLANDAWQRDFKAQAFLTILLRDSRRQPVGVLNAVSRNDISLSDSQTDLVMVLASRIAMEIEREKTLLALKESEEKFRAIADYTHDWETWTGPDGSLIWSNPAIERIIGYTLNEYEQLSQNQIIRITKIAHPDDRQTLVDIYRKGLEQQENCNDKPFKLIHKDGTIRWVSLSFQSIYADDGKFLGLRSSIRDITERKKAEEDLRESEGRYRRVIETHPDPMILFEDNGYVDYFNPAFSRTFGYHLNEYAGRQIAGFVPEDESRHAQSMIDDIKNGKTITGLETQRCKKDGQPVPVRISGGGHFDKQRKLIGYLMTIQDISEVKQNIEDKKKLEQQLINAQKLEALGILAGGIAHDFNNILGSIIGYAELMELFDVDENSEMYANLKEISGAAYRAKDLVQQILTFSRRTKIEKMPIKLAPIVKDTVKLLRATLPSTITIYEHIENIDETVIADRTQMHQVIMNLGTNATQAMQDATGTLIVELSKEMIDAKKSEEFLEINPGPYVKIVVKDTGCGMSKETMDKIFDPYFTTKKHGQGTGLGLSVTHGIIKAHEGLITVQSQIGQGSTFSVFLPLKQDPSNEEYLTQVSVKRGQGRILFVDDEESLVIFSRKVLVNLGYEVVPMTDSEKAYDIFCKTPNEFDLVITDQTMPKLTGLELIQKIKKIRPDVPIVLCTGYSEQVNRESIRDAGIQAFVEKPIGARQLSEIVAEFIGD